MPLRDPFERAFSRWHFKVKGVVAGKREDLTFRAATFAEVAAEYHLFW